MQDLEVHRRPQTSFELAYLVRLWRECEDERAQSAFRIGLTAQEDVGRSKSRLGPGMDRDVGLSQEHDAGDPKAGAKTVETGEQDARACRLGDFPQGGLQTFTVGKARWLNPEEIDQSVYPARLMRAHLCPPPDAPAQPPPV